MGFIFGADTGRGGALRSPWWLRHREPSPAITLFATTVLFTCSFLFLKILELRWRGESLDQLAKIKPT